MTKSWRASPLGLLLFIAAMAIASSAEAASKTKRQAAPPQTANGTATCRGGNLFPCGAVYSGNDYLGTDPDPFIRMMIQRDLGARYGGGP